MTVKELLEILKTADLDSVVVYEDCEGTVPASHVQEYQIDDPLDVHWAAECQEALKLGTKVLSIGY